MFSLTISDDYGRSYKIQQIPESGPWPILITSEEGDKTGVSEQDLFELLDEYVKREF